MLQIKDLMVFKISTSLFPISAPIYLALFSIKTSAIEIGKCGNLFRKNFEICKDDDVFKNSDPESNEGYSIRSDCATMAAFAMPVGWKDYKAKDVKFAYYTTHDPLILPDLDKIVGRTGSKTEPLKINEVEKSGNHKDFHKWCPMYDYNLRKDEQFQNRETCCNHASTTAFETIDATYVAGNFEIFQKHNLYQVYPKCYDLLRYMPCMVCDPRVQEENYTFQVGFYRPDQYTVEVPYYTYRLCDYYATEIWYQCRRAFFLTNGRKLVVPEKMGLEQFKEMVGVPSYHGLADDKCFNISDVNPFYDE